MRRLTAILIIIMAATAAGAGPGPEVPKGYELLFREGTLDDLPRARALAYERAVVNRLMPDAEERDSGRIVLGLSGPERGQATLRFEQGEKYRALGSFPASAGNPIIMYFIETVVRDMAESTGGSPYYIRNRIKKALLKDLELSHARTEFEGKTVETQVVEFRPFATDPKADRMQGFDKLKLRVEMLDAAPGWYLLLRADATGKDGPVYSSVLRLDGVEDAP